MSDGVTNLTEYQAVPHPRGIHKRYLAEGVVNSFFNTRFAIANPQATDSHGAAHFVDGNGRDDAPLRRRPAARARAPWMRRRSRHWRARRSRRRSTLTRSWCSIRSMAWSAGRYAAHTRPPSSGRRRRGISRKAPRTAVRAVLSAQNPSAAAADVHVRYLRPRAHPSSRPTRCRATAASRSGSIKKTGPFTRPTCRPRSRRPTTCRSSSSGRCI